MSPITDRQLAHRRDCIGASDVPVLLGLIPSRNAEDLRLEKLGLVEPQPETPAQLSGKIFEPHLVRWAAEQIGVAVRLNQRRVLKGTPLAANIDGIGRLPGTDIPVLFEAKTCGIDSPGFDREKWGPHGSHQVPDHVYAQTQVQLACESRANLDYVPLKLGGHHERLLVVERDDSFIADITLIVVQWWQLHIVEGRPVEAMPPHLDILKRMKRHTEEVPVPSELFEACVRAHREASKAEKARKEADRHMLAALGQADAGVCDLGKFTYYECDRKEYTVKAGKYRRLVLKEDEENGEADAENGNDGGKG